MMKLGLDARTKNLLPQIATTKDLPFKLNERYTMNNSYEITINNMCNENIVPEQCVKQRDLLRERRSRYLPSLSVQQLTCSSDVISSASVIVIPMPATLVSTREGRSSLGTRH